MTKQANPNRDLTKKDLIKILEAIDSERSRQELKESAAAQEELHE